MKFSDSLTTALLTGYSCFTTFRVDNNSVKGFSRHVERLQNNSDILFGITPSKKEIITAITEFLDNQISQQILVRVAIFPENFSIIAPGDIKKIQIIVTGREVSIPQKPLTLELHENIRPLAHLKTSSLFQSLQTRKNAQKLQEALIALRSKRDGGDYHDIAIALMGENFVDEAWDGGHSPLKQKMCRIYKSAQEYRDGKYLSLLE